MTTVTSLFSGVTAPVPLPDEYPAFDAVKEYSPYGTPSNETVPPSPVTPDRYTPLTEAPDTAFPSDVMTFTVTFYDEAGEEIDSQEIVYGEDAVAPQMASTSIHSIWLSGNMSGFSSTSILLGSKKYG